MIGGMLAGFLAGAGGGSSGGAFESLATVTLSSSSSSISFNSISSSYKHLQIRGMTVGTTGSQDILIQVNGITTTNSYSWHELRGNGALASTNGYANTAYMYIAANATDPTYPTSFVCDILDYQNTNKYKTIRVLSGGDRNGSGTIDFISGARLDTAAISSITIYTPGAYPFFANSHFALYGIKG